MAARRQTRAEPLEPLVPPDEPDDLSSHAHRQFIGASGFFLPLLLWLMAGVRETEGLRPWQLLESVSAYYHTGAVAAFVGVLIALAVFLFTYRGYDNDGHRRDRIAALIAGAAATIVAIFPTSAPDGVPAPRWWMESTGVIHYVAAVILFSAFAYFSLFLFPRTRPGEEPSPGKKVRNAIYRACGIAILAGMLWAGIASILEAPIFWPEALAIEAFAVSWLAKGRADRSAFAALRRVGYYGRNPGELARSLREAVQGSGR